MGVACRNDGETILFGSFALGESSEIFQSKRFRDRLRLKFKRRRKVAFFASGYEPKRQRTTPRWRNNGRVGGIRTPDRRIRNQVLYPTELLPHILTLMRKEAERNTSPFENSRSKSIGLQQWEFVLVGADSYSGLLRRERDDTLSRFDVVFGDVHRCFSFAHENHGQALHHCASD